MAVTKKRNNPIKKKISVEDIPEKEYAEFLEGIKNMIRETQSKVACYRDDILEFLPNDVPTVSNLKRNLRKKIR
jgi:hypothetical protein